jgi:hypothetical protein
MRELTQEEINQVSAGPTPCTPFIASPTPPPADASRVPTYLSFAAPIQFDLPQLPVGKLP